MISSRELIEMLRERLRQKGKLTAGMDAVLAAIERQLEGPSPAGKEA